jgi:eukaryotic-like serine/threonine-protein kinase
MNYGRYQIVGELGKGSMGVVYKAHDPQIDRSLALKVLRPDRITSEEFVRRFLKEAQAIGRLSHANIVTLYDVGQDHGTIFIAMELLTGKTLKDAMAERQLTAQEIIHIGVQVAEALDYAHQKGIVHRDIKPSNIILTSDGPAKLTDFGIARIEDPAAHQQTQAGEILGTPVYMSPEQVMGQPVDGRSDLYSLGVILYEMAMGRKPFSGESIAAVFSSIVQETPPEPIIPDSPIAPRLSALIMKAISKRPEDRFSTGREMAQPLKACLERRKSDVQRQERETPKPKPRHNVLYAAIALIVIVVSGGGYFATQTILDRIRSRTEPNPMVEAHAALNVSSDPTGADVFLDGSFRGKTPVKVDLPLGKYEVRVTLHNYYDWEAQLQLDQKGDVPLFVRLLPTETGKP